MVWPADGHFKIATKTSAYAQYISPLNRDRKFLRNIAYEKFKKLPYIGKYCFLDKEQP